MTERTLEDIYADLGKAVYIFRNNKDESAYHTLEEIFDKYDTEITFSLAKFKKGQTVYVFVSDYIPEIIKAEVSYVYVNSCGDLMYQLYEKTGRNVGRWPEHLVFNSTEALHRYFEKFFKENL